MFFDELSFNIPKMAKENTVKSNGRTYVNFISVHM